MQETATSCISSGLVQVTVNAIPNGPADPTATVTSQPTCPTPTGTIDVTSPVGANIEYSVDGINYQSSGTFTGLIPGTYNITALDNVTGCVNSGTIQLTVDPVPGLPAAPTASVTFQPTCTTPSGSIDVTVPSGANYEYSIDGITFQAGTTFTGLLPGTYDLSLIHI